MMGGHQMIRVENVKIVKTNKTYKAVFHSLFLMDSILSDNKLTKDFKITQTDTNRIKHLFNETQLTSFDPYFQRMIRSYIRNKKQIAINMMGLWRFSASDIGKDLIGMIVANKVERMNAVPSKDIDWSKLSNRNNLLASGIFDIFPSAEIITINNGAVGTSFIFDLFCFLEMISKSVTWKIIKIREMVGRRNRGKSWFGLYYNSCSSALDSEYQKHGLRIQFESVAVYMGQFYDECMTICRV